MTHIKDNAIEILNQLGVDISAYQGTRIKCKSPINGELLLSVKEDKPNLINDKIDLAHHAFLKWKNVPAPRRGELLRLFGQELRVHKESLGMLVTIESGKILQEGLGEVQEMIDICDFAVGLSRQLYGLTIASERPGHRMMEVWHPVGVVGVISAFNFPVAVWAWNAALALVCGNSVVWKPSEKTPLTAIAVQALFTKAMNKFGNDAPSGLSQLILGYSDTGRVLVNCPHIKVISATGSTRMGREVAYDASDRFAKTILELGGNNAMIVTPQADLDMALRAIVFSAVGTAGQRCTTLRRLIVHKSIKDELLNKLKSVYSNLRIGNPLQPDTLVGPLIDKKSYIHMQWTLNFLKLTNVCDIFGGQRMTVEGNDGYYVAPAIVTINDKTQLHLTNEEVFAPILYVIDYDTLEEAIEINNGVPQGLSSSIFTTNIIEAELFLSSSDCGIANVNIGPSGAEIGGAFGGEKDTGGGRESGSDAWKNYMRRATNTINYSNKLPLAQGINFDFKTH